MADSTLFDAAGVSVNTANDVADSATAANVDGMKRFISLSFGFCSPVKKYDALQAPWQADAVAHPS
jgi:hypothetical protein